MMRKPLLFVLSCLLITILLVLADLFNITQYIGLSISSLNWNFISVLFNNVVVVCLFIFTYFFIDRNNIIQKRNQGKNAKIFLQKIYKQCYINIKLLDSEMGFLAMIHDGVDMNNQEDVIKCFNFPFDNEEYVFNACNDGVLKSKELETYIDFKDKYKRYVLYKTATYLNHNDKDVSKESLMFKTMEEEKTTLLDIIQSQSVI